MWENHKNFKKNKQHKKKKKKSYHIYCINQWFPSLIIGYCSIKILHTLKNKYRNQLHSVSGAISSSWKQSGYHRFKILLLSTKSILTQLIINDVLNYTSWSCNFFLNCWFLSIIEIGFLVRAIPWRRCYFFYSKRFLIKPR